MLCRCTLSQENYQERAFCRLMRGYHALVDRGQGYGRCVQTLR